LAQLREARRPVDADAVVESGNALGRPTWEVPPRRLRLIVSRVTTWTSCFKQGPNAGCNRVLVGADQGPRRSVPRRWSAAAAETPNARPDRLRVKWHAARPNDRPRPHKPTRQNIGAIIRRCRRSPKSGPGIPPSLPRPERASVAGAVLLPHPASPRLPG